MRWLVADTEVRVLGGANGRIERSSRTGEDRMDARNKYRDDKAIKWIIAQKERGGDWKIRFLSLKENIPSLDNVLDSTQICQIRNSEFSVFRNRRDWWKLKPRRYYRGYDLEISLLNLRILFGDLINALDADWF